MSRSIVERILECERGAAELHGADRRALAWVMSEETRRAVMRLDYQPGQLWAFVERGGRTLPLLCGHPMRVDDDMEYGKMKLCIAPERPVGEPSEGESYES